MSKRIKIEDFTSKLQRSRSTVKRTAYTSTKKKSKKHVSVINVNDNSSDEEFLLKPSNKKKQPLSSKQAVEPQSSKVLNLSLRSSKRKHTTLENIYSISDSSDDESTVINRKNTDNKIIDLCETENESVSNSVLEQVIEKSPMKKEDNCYPSTSKEEPVSSSVENHTKNFIDKLLDENQELLGGNYSLTTLKELNEQTNKLLTSSSELINKEQQNDINFNNSVIYVCTNKDPMKKLKEKNISGSSINILEQKQGEKIKANCPICLETFGVEPVSATVCGHIFCKLCIENCIKSQKRCPTCRKRLNMKKVHPLFLF